MNEGFDFAIKKRNEGILEEKQEVFARLMQEKKEALAAAMKTKDENLIKQRLNEYDSAITEMKFTNPLVTEVPDDALLLQQARELTFKHNNNIDAGQVN